jgi:hypothetical protein
VVPGLGQGFSEVPADTGAGAGHQDGFLVLRMDIWRAGDNQTSDEQNLGKLETILHISSCVVHGGSAHCKPQACHPRNFMMRPDTLITFVPTSES